MGAPMRAKERQMLKRLLLVCTFIAALGAAGLGVSGKASAWDDCGPGYRTYYSAYPAYPSNYYGYTPNVAFYRSPVVVRDYDFHDRHHYEHHHHDHDHNF